MTDSSPRHHAKEKGVYMSLKAVGESPPLEAGKGTYHAENGRVIIVRNILGNEHFLFRQGSKGLPYTGLM